MGDIVLLDDLTINKIAAGEVIERPANVVKELVENSIDAGATSISVDIENGGITYIRITDNGKGIAPDDVEIAFERHATSKIRSANDLIKVSTMGFRGEALASIAAIAKVELITKTKDNDIGTRIVVEGGKILVKEECGAPNGTTITIRELFFNTPVRYKFLKKDFTEGGYIEDAVSRIALIHPELSFRMTNNKKEIVRTSGNGDMKSVVYSIYGKDIAQNLVDVNLEYEGIKVTGVAGKPEIARSNRSNQLFYINGRYIKDKILSAATEEAYRTLIPHGKFGFCIINLEMNPELVDVNVHPAKLEVRFSEEGKVFKAVNASIKNALLKQDITKESTVDEEDVKEDKKEEIVEEKKKSGGLFDLFRSKSNVVDFLKKEEKIEELEKFEEIKKVDTLEDNKEEYSVEDTKNTMTIEVRNNSEEKKEIIKEEIVDEETGEIIERKPQENLFENIAIVEEKADIPEYKILGVAFKTYILLELDEDVYILDQHAAHERVLYEKVKQNFYKDGGKDIQMLLLPDIIELSKRDMRTVRDNIDLFEQSGFALEEFGDNTIKITGVPVICFDMDTKELFMDIIDGIDFTNRTTKQDVEEKFISTVACKAAVKANMALEESEIRGLLDQLLLLDNPFTCPHGRPTAIRITKNEIEKKFGRK
ncbi:MAG: DNA mismatch repair endonuclease MutL [Clostridia bacterium]|nr:DNA mismatch repair endonuclease MutL [Clostridia bacterium]